MMGRKNNRRDKNNRRNNENRRMGGKKDRQEKALKMESKSGGQRWREKTKIAVQRLAMIEEIRLWQRKGEKLEL